MARRQIGFALAAMLAVAALWLRTLSGGAPVAPAVEQATRPVALEAASRVFVQLDACDSEAEARVSAARNVRRGSAGYIHCDGQYRVLGAMAADAGEAERMISAMRDSDGRATAYPSEAGQLTMQVTAEPEQIDALSGALRALDVACAQPEAIARLLDAGEIDAGQARGLVAMLASDVEAARANFAAAGATGLLPERIAGALAAAADGLDRLTCDDGQTGLALAGQIRGAGIRAWFDRVALAELADG